MDSGGSFVRIAQFAATHTFGHFGGTRLEDKFESTDLLVGDGDEAARLFGFGAGRGQAVIGDLDVDFAPVEQTLHTVQSRDRQLNAGRRALGRVHLHQNHLDPRFSRINLECLLGDGAIAFRKDLARLVEDSLPLLERDVEGEITT
jgi:hypothetical protein